MQLFENPLLNQETSIIMNNSLPEHNTTVSAILHLKELDYTPDKVFAGETLSDYDKLTDLIVVTMLLSRSEYRKYLLKNRDKFQITLIINANGKVIRERFNGVLITQLPDEMDSEAYKVMNQNILDGELISVEVQCIPILFTMIKQFTTRGSATNVDVATFIRSYISRNMKLIEIDSKPLEPIVNVSTPDNLRVYHSIVMDSKVSVIDIPTYLQEKLGVYNGGLGTYIHTIDGKPTISVYPLFTVSKNSDKMKLVVYIADTKSVANSSNKTVVVENNALKVISTSNYNRIDYGQTSDMDTGATIVTTNSNQVMDRVYTDKDGKLIANRDKMVDVVADKSDNINRTTKVVSPTDNLYLERSKIIRAKAKIVQLQWNYSRPDMLFPNMEVEIVRTKKGEVIREKGVLMSHYTKIDNTYSVASTLLNIIIV